MSDLPPIGGYQDEPRANGGRKPSQAVTVASALEIEPASTWAGRPEPPPRDWVIEDLIPARRVTSLLGNGGLGKTLLAVQIAVHVSISRAIFGQQVNGGPVLGVFCEDEREELERRARAACAGEQIALDMLDRLYMTSRDGEDNLLCTFEHEQILATKFYRELEATIAQIKPRLTILDTAADLFGGDFMSTPQVRQFLKVALGGLCVRHDTAILLLAHPSASGMASGDGGGFSTAWHNSVRSRMYLRRPKTEDAEAAKDRRVLELKKANLGPDGTMIPLRYEHGYFVPDLEPLEEGKKPPRARATGCTKLGMAAMEYMRRTAPSGQVVTFRALFDALQAARDIEPGPYQTARKPLQRTLRQLADEALIVATEVPRGGYRLVPSAPEEPA